MTPQGGQAVYTTQNSVGYLHRAVVSLRVRYEQLTRLDFHQLDCSLVGCSESLQVGDIIYRINRRSVTSSERLRHLLSGIKAGQPVAFQVEREGRLRFVAREIP